MVTCKCLEAEAKSTYSSQLKSIHSRGKKTSHINAPKSGMSRVRKKEHYLTATGRARGKEKVCEQGTWDILE